MDHREQVERVMDLVESMIAPEIMTLREALAFLEELNDRVWDRTEAIRDDLVD